MRHALPTSSCTGALHLALLALGIGPGDEVIVPDLTWVATANAVAYTGATPVFADVEPVSWCLDPAAFEAAITPRTKAVMPVHLYGHPARMDAIADGRRAPTACTSSRTPRRRIGAEVAGQRAGSFGAAAGFSFQGAKLLVTGEGGMLVTDDDEVYERARYCWTMGREGDFWIGETGFKYRLSNVQAAIGLGQLERIDQLIEAKRRIFGWYEEELGGVAGRHAQPRGRLGAQHLLDDQRPASSPSARTDRDELRAALRRRGHRHPAGLPGHQPLSDVDAAPAGRPRRRPHRRPGDQPAQRRVPAPRRGGPRRRERAPRAGRGAGRRAPAPGGMSAPDGLRRDPGQERAGLPRGGDRERAGAGGSSSSRCACWTTAPTTTPSRSHAGYTSDPRVTAERNPVDVFYYGSLNRILARTQAEYFVPFAADDVMYPGNLARKVQALRDTGAGFVSSSSDLIDETGAKVGMEPDHAATPAVVAAPEFFARIAPRNAVSCQSVLARVDALRAIGGFDGRSFYAGDWLTWMRLALRWPVATIAEPLIANRVHAQAGTQASNASGLNGRDIPMTLDRVFLDEAMPAPWQAWRDPMVAVPMPTSRRT